MKKSVKIFFSMAIKHSLGAKACKKYLKSFDIGLWEMGAKRLLNGVRKCDG